MSNITVLPVAVEATNIVTASLGAAVPKEIDLTKVGMCTHIQRYTRVVKYIKHIVLSHRRHFKAELISHCVSVYLI